MTLILLALGFLVLVTIQGFFSGSEIALVNSDKAKLRYKSKQGQSGSTLALKMFEKPEVVLTTTLVGTNIALVLSAVLGTTLAVSLVGDAGELLAILIMTPITLIFGEVVPKSVFQQQANRLTPIVIYPLYALSILLFPIVFVFSRVARIAARIIGRGGRPGAEMFAVREQLRAVLETSEGASPESPFDRMRIRNVVRFGELSAADLMTPAAEMSAVDSNQRLNKAIKLARSGGLTHIPVFEGRRANVIGMVSLTAWSLVDSDIADKDFASLIRPAFYVPALQPVAELLPVLRGREDQSALVVDEFGSVIGLISVDMILESIVGNVEISSNSEGRKPKRKPGYKLIDDDVYLMDGRMPITDINELLATRIGTAMAYTIGGLITSRLRHVPKLGESIEENGFLFVVEEATDRLAKKIRVERLVSKTKAE